MKRTATFFLATVLVFAVLASGLYAGGFQLNEHGSRAKAQGGAWAARAYDASAIFWNPAGLGFQKGSHFLGGTTLIMPVMEFYGPHNLGLNEKTELNSKIFTPINIYGTYEISDGFTFGFGIYNPYGLGTSWPEDWVGKYISIDVELRSFFFSPTIGYRVSDNLSVGVGFNYVYGDVIIKRAISIPFAGAPPVVDMELAGTGMGFNAGLLYKITDDLSIGATYRHAIDLKAEGTADFDPNYAVLGLPEGDVASSLTLPTTAMLGIAYKVTPDFEIEADYQYVGWSSYDKLEIEFKANNTVSSSPKEYQDSYILRFGAEYTMGDIQLRAGYLYDKNPVPDKYVEPLLPDANRNGLNIGVGYKLSENTHMDISYLLLLFDDRKATGTEVQLDGTYRATANLIGINIGYSF